MVRYPHKSANEIFEFSVEKESEQITEASFTQADIAADEIDHSAWEAASAVPIKRYWSGEEAPAGRQAEGRLLWSERALCARFICRQSEPLVVSSHPQTERKSLGLWERDVCELFIAPDPGVPERYFEFEAAPTGEWLDLIVQHGKDTRETDWDFISGMTVGARVASNVVTIAMRVPWDALGRVPRNGDEWRGNLFRCVGIDPMRGYLAWRPTCTDEPDFHVPTAFGRIRFTTSQF